MTIIGEEDISISISYVVNVNKGGSIGELNSFFVKIPLNIKEIFSLADEIINAEADSQTFCNTFWNWIYTYQESYQEIPPLDYFDFGGGTTTWLKGNVQNFLEENIFLRFVPLLRIMETQNYVNNIPEGDFENNIDRIQIGIISGLGLGILSKPYNISVNFFYHPDWDIYLNVVPSDGQVIRTDSFSNNILGFIGLDFQRGNFHYDISVPLWVTLTDDNALNGEGYNFQFAFESNIRSNKCLTAGSITNIIESNEETLFDDSDLWLSGNITIETQDNFGVPVEGVSVRYGCGPVSVLIGDTEINGDGKARIVSPFPVCQGGLLMLSKEGYLGYDGILFDTVMGESAYILVQV
jgi:hypothetical protein